MSLSKVIKSISDKRIYRPISLHNDLQCLVISDKDAQKSAAALSVEVGSLTDPREAQGLAHYLEHMLFMGTKKYPEENEYSNVVWMLFSICQKTRGRLMLTHPLKRPTSTLRCLMGPLRGRLTDLHGFSLIP